MTIDTQETYEGTCSSTNNHQEITEIGCRIRQSITGIINHSGIRARGENRQGIVHREWERAEVWNRVVFDTDHSGVLDLDHSVVQGCDRYSGDTVTRG